MRVLWVVNLVLPSMYGGDNSLKTSGGWMEALLHGLVETGDIELHVVAPDSKTVIDYSVVDGVHFHTIKTNYITKVLFANQGVCKDLSKLFSEVLPEVIHIHGTEFPFMEDALDAANDKGIPVVTSIQGLISEICKPKEHYAGISTSSVIHDFLKYGPRVMIPLVISRVISRIRARSELRQLKKNNVIIGRTRWDKEHCLYVNPNLEYWSIQEIIRDAFFKEEWVETKTEKGRIFCAGGCRSPIKGFHQILIAIASLQEEHKEFLTITVPGTSPFIGKTYGYKLYLKELIEELNLKEKIKFLGSLSAKEMALEFTKAEIYIMGSSIENSANTLGEALIVGTPSIVPDVGGISSIGRANTDMLMYEFGDNNGLKEMIQLLLSDQGKRNYLSKNSKEKRNSQYNREKIINDYIELYRYLIK